MTILRVDFSSEIGLGHLKRIEVFVQRYNIENPLIVCKKCDENLTKLSTLKVSSEEEFFKQVKKINPEWVIIDNYNFTYENEKEFKKLFPQIKLSVFDDFYAKHFCDEVLNHNLGVKIEKYEKPEIVKIIKPLIRKEFFVAKKKRLKKEGIFISLGGSDAKELTLKILKILKIKKLTVNLYITSANKNIEKIKKFCKVNKWVKLHINEDVAMGMSKSKFGIITPSGISYEALFMNLPFVAIEVADNQKELVKYLKRKHIKILKPNEIRKILYLIKGKI
ncbi:UDP-2,4-diacetamido-2,4,6-trideoxy-beta-L-altropyranose hydrolase [Lebetimonas natsushimae]|uniref:UDP-2,4-diacetamido-2,4,6-trideoxy-beta-L-altropyranose hydrolase n=1 Tax=Lebetimonas natsushimae TaxID=1936991 RepID=A0A292YEM6_9BACT|nr:UDP-2,4-diacetamido-2,4,6-trideoxy-beta-L-altropyranose hydrolase [Lebetimonas natsushimae]GAX87595.1 UDP-2,4-diacetamido-2,4,6-trideoxy-beta-L-altropyranose hydrolase [Lebetimonas natsushimae]